MRRGSVLFHLVTLKIYFGESESSVSAIIFPWIFAPDAVTRYPVSVPGGSCVFSSVALWLTRGHLSPFLPSADALEATSDEALSSQDAPGLR